MTNAVKNEPSAALVQALADDLLAKYGPLLTGEALREALCYRSLEAMRQAILRGTMPVPVFSIEHRRGKFALAKEVAIWLAEQRASICEDIPLNTQYLSKEENDGVT